LPEAVSGAATGAVRVGEGPGSVAATEEALAKRLAKARKRTVLERICIRMRMSLRNTAKYSFLTHLGVKKWQQS
jgi:hypothetical protein